MVSYIYKTIAGFTVEVIAYAVAAVLPLVVIKPVMIIPVYCCSVKSGFSTATVKRPSRWRL